MNMNELYARTPERETFDLNLIKDHIYESGYNQLDGDRQSNTRIQIKAISELQLDARRVWRLYTVWFKDMPFMVCQNAGREGDDFSQRYISDLQLFKEAMNYIRMLCFLEPNFGQARTNPEIDIEALTSFYDGDLNDP